MALKIGEKYLKGELDLGIFGNADILAFKNKDKESEKAPDYNLFISKGEELIPAGVLWVNEKQPDEDEVPREEVKSEPDVGIG